MVLSVRFLSTQINNLSDISLDDASLAEMAGTPPQAFLQAISPPKTH
jgi:hypothetical protein